MGDTADDIRHSFVETASFRIVGRFDEVDAPVGKKVFNQLLFAFSVDGDRISAQQPDKPHARHVGEAVADINHVSERDAAVFFGNVSVD